MSSITDIVARIDDTTREIQALETQLEDLRVSILVTARAHANTQTGEPLALLNERLRLSKKNFNDLVKQESSPSPVTLLTYRDSETIRNTLYNASGELTAVCCIFIFICFTSYR